MVHHGQLLHTIVSKDCQRMAIVPDVKNVQTILHRCLQYLVGYLNSGQRSQQVICFGVEQDSRKVYGVPTTQGMTVARYERELAVRFEEEWLERLLPAIPPKEASPCYKFECLSVLPTAEEVERIRPSTPVPKALVFFYLKTTLPSPTGTGLWAVKPDEYEEECSFYCSEQGDLHRMTPLQIASTVQNYIICGSAAAKAKPAPSSQFTTPEDLREMLDAAEVNRDDEDGDAAAESTITADNVLAVLRKHGRAPHPRMANIVGLQAREILLYYQGKNPKLDRCDSTDLKQTRRVLASMPELKYDKDKKTYLLAL